MKMEYEDFVKELTKILVRETGFSKDKVYFAKKGTKLTAMGDRLFVECSSHEDVREVCGVYIQELYERYQKDMDMNEIAENVLAEIRHLQRSGLFQETRKLSSYETAKKELFIRLLSAEQRGEELKHAVCQRMGDIALVLYMKVADVEGCITSLKIRPEYLEEWGEEETAVFREALQNTMRVTPPRLYFWEKLLYDSDYGGEEFMEAGRDTKLRGDALGNCISTSRRTNGAVAVFLPGVADRIAGALKNDLYLAFTSIHEVMVHNAAEVEIENLKEVLKHTIEEATPGEDYLSSQIYRYSRLTQEFSCVTKEGLPTYSNREY